MSKREVEVIQERSAEKEMAQWQSQVLVSVLFGKTVMLLLAEDCDHDGGSFTMTVNFRERMMMWVFTHLFHHQIYVCRSLNVALMVSPWRLSTMTASLSSSRLSPEMSDVSCVTSHLESYSGGDSCGVLSLRFGIWTRTKSLHLLVHKCVWDNLPL